MTTRTMMKTAMLMICVSLSTPSKAELPINEIMQAMKIGAKVGKEAAPIVKPIFKAIYKKAKAKHKAWKEKREERQWAKRKYVNPYRVLHDLEELDDLHTIR